MLFFSVCRKGSDHADSSIMCQQLISHFEPESQQLQQTMLTYAHATNSVANIIINLKKLVLILSDWPLCVCVRARARVRARACEREREACAVHYCVSTKIWTLRLN
jgi:hypothetical protein